MTGRADVDAGRQRADASRPAAETVGQAGGGHRKDDRSSCPAPGPATIRDVRLTGARVRREPSVVPDMVANLSKVGPLGVAPPPDDMDARPAPRPISPRPGVHDNGDVEIP